MQWRLFSFSVIDRLPPPSASLSAEIGAPPLPAMQGRKEGSASAPLGPNGDEADVHHTGSGGSGDAQLCVGPVGHRRFGQPFVGGRRPRCGRSIGVKAAPPLASLRLTFFAKLNKRKRSSSLLEGAGQLKQPWASQRETLEMPCENDSMTDSKMWI